MTEEELNDLAKEMLSPLEDKDVDVFLVIQSRTPENPMSSRVHIHKERGRSANLLQGVWRALGLFFVHHYEHPISDISTHFLAGGDVASCVVKTVLAQTELLSTPPAANEVN